MHYAGQWQRRFLEDLLGYAQKKGGYFLYQGFREEVLDLGDKRDVKNVYPSPLHGGWSGVMRPITEQITTQGFVRLPQRCIFMCLGYLEYIEGFF